MSALRIGLTGGIGSGKSTVAAMLADCGAKVVDTDAIARGLTLAGGAALPALAEAFGSDMLGPDGAMDRGRMRELVFVDPGALKRLEAILHPLILAQALDQASQAAVGQTVVFDVPLLVESGHWRQRVDKVLVVDCEEDEQVRRVMARSAWGEAQTRQVMAKQATRAQRRAAADTVLFNQGLSLDELRAQVRECWKAWHGAYPSMGDARAVEQ